MKYCLMPAQKSFFPASFFDWNEELLTKSEGRFGQEYLDEDEKQFLVSIDLPGMKKEELSVLLENNYLVIKGERKESQTRKSSTRTFERRLLLPELAKEEDVQAKYEDGVLDITIPKIEKKPQKLIPIS
jgi:HSP20 family protein